MNAKQFFFAPYRLDVVNHQLCRGDHQVPLRPKTFALLQYIDGMTPAEAGTVAQWVGVSNLNPESHVYLLADGKPAGSCHFQFVPPPQTWRSSRLSLEK